MQNNYGKEESRNGLTDEVYPVNSITDIEEELRKAEDNPEPPEYVLEAAKYCEIKASDEMEAPPTCLEIETADGLSIFGTLGNFGCIIGKAKSRKSFVGTYIAAAAAANSQVLNVKGNFSEDKRKVLYFDTEQEKFHVLQIARRITRLTGNGWKEHPENLHVYGLRKYPPNRRREIIEHIIYNTENVGFVMIDGLRDLVDSINDEEQATRATSDLLRWTEERGIYILTVLHQNKGDGNARGHLGTEVVNKAETIISVAKLESDKNVSEIKSEFTRNADFDSFFIGIDGDTLPYIEDGYEKKKGGSARAGWQSLTDNQHIEKVRQIFLTPNCLAYKTDRSARDMNKDISEYYSVSDRTARDILKLLENRGFIYNRNSGGSNGISYKYCISAELNDFN